MRVYSLVIITTENGIHVTPVTLPPPLLTNLSSGKETRTLTIEKKLQTTMADQYTYTQNNIKCNITVKM